MSEALLFSVLLVVCLGTWVYGTPYMKILKLKPGERITVVCSTALKHQEGLYVYWSMPQQVDVLYLHKHPHTLTIGEFQGRVDTTGNFTMFNVTFSNLTVYNSGFYWCQYEKFNSKTNRLEKTLGEGPVTMVHMNDPLAMEVDRNTTPRPTRTPLKTSSQTGVEMNWIIAGLSASSVFLVCVIILCGTTKMKRFCKRGQFQPHSRDTVYEEMNLNRIR
ncbi:hypothetical protein AAFF_G00340050 [Aldrovandia affinis]|uniref:Ig-like domain-containing protein n=1 Tax=Aldrovandia affinis TaxID=143900 RepID=A0AAD7WP86_9TELE|nr:hypothetical protein AAFF_G00340050 [Aldrovandia affinis]